MPDRQDWQRFTNDPEDVDATDRCAAVDGDPVKDRSGICLRRNGHPPDWHEGRSRSGNLVSWPGDRAKRIRRDDDGR